MPHIAVIFEIRRAETRPGEVVSVVGSVPELGDWDPFDCDAAPLQLHTSTAQYPRWGMTAPVQIELSSGGDDGGAEMAERWDADFEEEVDDCTFSVPESPCGTISQVTSAEGLPPTQFVRLEYKFVRDRRQLKEGGPSIQWEECIPNRRVMIPREHGSIWIIADSAFNQAGEPQVSRRTLTEVLARRRDLDPEWTTSAHWDNREAPESERPPTEGLSSRGSVGTDLTSYSGHTTSTVFKLAFALR